MSWGVPLFSTFARMGQQGVRRDHRRRAAGRVAKTGSSWESHTRGFPQLHSVQSMKPSPAPVADLRGLFRHYGVVTLSTWVRAGLVYPQRVNLKLAVASLCPKLNVTRLIGRKARGF